MNIDRRITNKTNEVFEGISFAYQVPKVRHYGVLTFQYGRVTGYITFSNKAELLNWVKTTKVEAYKILDASPLDVEVTVTLKDLNND